MAKQTIEKKGPSYIAFETEDPTNFLNPQTLDSTTRRPSYMSNLVVQIRHSVPTNTYRHANWFQRRGTVWMLIHRVVCAQFSRDFPSITASQKLSSPASWHFLFWCALGILARVSWNVNYTVGYRHYSCTSCV